MLPTLPEDCTSKIFSYVSLHTALKYASTSTESLNNILTDLKFRRQRISQKMAWVDCPVLIDTKLYNAETFKRAGDDIYYIPSALDRMKCLRNSLNVLHPLRDSVHELIVNVDEDEEFDSRDLSGFKASFSALQKVIKAHKLHGAILNRALYDEPILDKNKVPLHRYVGDMLIIYFCMGHSVSNIVEGVSENKWINALMGKFESPHRDKKVLGSNDWYQLYACLHSTMLRTFPLLKHQLLRLGIATDGMVNIMAQGKSYNSTSLLPQPKQFRGMKKAQLVEKIGECQTQCGLTCKIFEFGSLGPLFTFRGRDNLRYLQLTPVTLGVESIVFVEEMPISEVNCMNIPLLHILRDDTFEPVLQLMQAYRESKKVHPMNVAPPQLNFNVSSM